MRAVQEFQQRLGGVWGSRVRAHAAREGDARLDFGRQRADQLDAGRGHDLRDDNDPELDFALRHQLRHDIGVGTRDLWGNRRRNAEPLQQRSQIGTAADFEIADRLRVEQRARESLDRADVGLGRARPRSHADAGAYQVDPGIGGNPAIAYEPIERRPSGDDRVERLAGIDPRREFGWQAGDDVELVTARPLEFGTGLAQHSG